MASWKPGQSGNPSGRPKNIQYLGELARQHTDEALNTLVTIMRTGERESDRLRCAEILLDRGYGKPAQAIGLALEGDDGAILPIINISVRQPEPPKT